mmetsp:Transcript_6258/g.15747  ORF Transcript_6258/g.15747 Transcript_6258/m.15747 type:complete len:239 (+) Transcript_6258:573-1289(+)
MHLARQARWQIGQSTKDGLLSRERSISCWSDSVGLRAVLRIVLRVGSLYHIFSAEPINGLLDALRERSLGAVAELDPRLRDIGACAGYIARLRRQLTHDGVDAGTLAHNLDEALQADRVAVSKVVYLVPTRPIKCTNDTIHNVINKRIVARARAIAELLDLLAPQHSVHELEGRHVRASSGSVDGEEAKARHRYIVQVGVGMADKLAHLLGCSVRADGSLHHVILAENLIVGLAVHGG